MAYGGTSLTTTAPAATTAPSPIVMPRPSRTSCPIQTSFPTTGGAFCGFARYCPAMPASSKAASKIPWPSYKAADVEKVFIG